VDILPPPSAPRAASGVALRAALVLALLVLFYALAAAVVGGLVSLVVLAAKASHGFATVKLGVITIVVGAALARAVFHRSSASKALPGLPVARHEEPGLWSVVDDVARSLRTSPPDELRLLDDVNVTQDARLLGLLPGRRTMGVGLALLHVLTVDELRAVLAHEYGHYAGGDTRLGPLTYRARTTVCRAARNLEDRKVLGKVFGAYATLVLRTSLSVSRGQEVSADRAAAALVGPAVHESALRGTSAGAAAYELLLDDYVGPLAHRGICPDDIFDGFAALLADPDRQVELAQARSQVRSTVADRWDSHPSLAERLALLATLPPGGSSSDGRPGVVLLADHGAWARKLTAHLLAGSGVRLVAHGWAEAGEHYGAALQKHADALAHAAAVVDGRPAPAGVDRVLALVVAGQGERLVQELLNISQPLQDVRRAVAQVLTPPISALLARPLLAAGHVRYALAWSGPSRLVDANGRELLVHRDVRAALLDPSTIPAFRQKLLDAGLDLSDATPVRQPA
jgi:Zn-dependent protease with chaperone function